MALGEASIFASLVPPTSKVPRLQIGIPYTLTQCFNHCLNDRFSLCKRKHEIRSRVMYEIAGYRYVPWKQNRGG